MKKIVRTPLKTQAGSSDGGGGPQRRSRVIYKTTARNLFDGETAAVNKRLAGALLDTPKGHIYNFHVFLEVNSEKNISAKSKKKKEKPWL